MKTWNANAGEVDRNWWIIDATDVTLGRLASQVASLLKGKHKPQFTPHVDTGDFVVVLNTDKLRLSGAKMDAKKYFTRSRFFGSIKEKSARQWMERDSSHILMEAVKGMLPKNKLSRRLILKLKAYRNAEHPHSAQKPTAYSLKM
ncbi:MAG: 50S ribosomal protein L13 [Bdellovibrionales bacterium]|nr:50S ribosomal protein L13 [Bdellovibrionales bacterium]